MRHNTKKTESLPLLPPAEAIMHYSFTVLAAYLQYASISLRTSIKANNMYYIKDTHFKCMLKYQYWNLVERRYDMHEKWLNISITICV